LDNICYIDQRDGEVDWNQVGEMGIENVIKEVQSHIASGPGRGYFPSYPQPGPEAKSYITKCDAM